MRYLSIEQVTSILRCAWKESTRDHLMLLLAFNHGLRRVEIAELRVQDVSDGLIRVARAKGSLATVQPAMSSQNVLFDEIKALSSWLAARDAKTDALFPSRKGGGCMTPDSVGRVASYYMEMAGIPKELAHIHALKHACCSLLARQGVKIEYIAQHVGHKDIKNTRTYLNITDDEATAKAQQAFQSLTQN